MKIVSPLDRILTKNEKNIDAKPPIRFCINKKVIIFAVDKIKNKIRC
jgi:hypothetical protein